MSAYDVIPRWVLETIPVLFLGLIIAGGFWLKSLEKKAREAERQNKKPN